MFSNNSFNYDNRNLSEVFRELQQMQHNPNASSVDYKKYEKEQKKQKKLKDKAFMASLNKKSKSTAHIKTNDLKLSQIIIGCSILVVGLAVFFPKNTSFNESYAKSDDVQSLSEYEINRHRLNMQNIISENAGMNRVKEQVTEERDVEFETTYNNNPTLPKSEEVVVQEGVLGKDNVTAVKTYENGEFVESFIKSLDENIQ